MDYNSWSKCGEVQNQKLKRTGWWKGILDQPFEIIWINRLSMLYQTTMPNSRQIFPFAFEKILDKVCRNCGAFQFFSHDYVFRGRRVMLRWHYLRCSNWIPIGTILLSHDNDIFMLYTFDSFGCLHIQEEMLMIFWPIPFHAHIRAQEFHQSHSCSWWSLSNVQVEACLSSSIKGVQTVSGFEFDGGWSFFRGAVRTSIPQVTLGL